MTDCPYRGSQPVPCGAQKIRPHLQELTWAGHWFAGNEYGYCK